MKPVTPSRAFKHVYHAVYLQWLIGSVVAFLLPMVPRKGETDTVFGITPMSGWLLIGMGINIFCYLRRYEKALAEHALFEKSIKSVSADPG